MRGPLKVMSDNLDKAGILIRELRNAAEKWQAEQKTGRTVKMTLWEDGHLGSIELLAVPRVGERVVNAEGDHFEVLYVMHHSPSSSNLAQLHRLAFNKDAKPSIRLDVRQY